MTAVDIRACFREYYQYRFNEVGLFEFEISGVTYPKEPCRFDAFMITPHRQVMKGFEFKVSRSDFLADKRIRPKTYYSIRYYKTAAADDADRGNGPGPAAPDSFSFRGPGQNQERELFLIEC